jgi:hypothetical protein
MRVWNNFTGGSSNMDNAKVGMDTSFKKIKKMNPLRGGDPVQGELLFDLEDTDTVEDSGQALSTTLLRNSAKRSLGPRVSASDYWLSLNNGDIIDCPYQPGNLKITKNACLKRYQASAKTYPESINQANLFLYTVGSGLLRCKTCSIVEKLM